MSNKSKAAGTRFETEIVNSLVSEGLYARRLAEGGIWDQGDIELLDGASDLWIIEAKARANGNPHQWLHQAKGKAEKAGAPFVAVVWKRLVRKNEGQKRRTPDGERTIVCIDWETFKGLIG